MSLSGPFAVRVRQSSGFCCTPAPMAGSPLEEALIEGVAGSLGGVLGLAVTYPLLATSTRLHLDRSAVGGVAVPQVRAQPLGP